MCVCVSFFFPWAPAALISKCTFSCLSGFLVVAIGLLGGGWGRGGRDCWEVQGDCPGVREKLSLPGRVTFGAGTGNWTL